MKVGTAVGLLEFVFWGILEGRGGLTGYAVVAVLELKGRGGGAQEEDGGEVSQEGGCKMHFGGILGLVGCGTGVCDLNEWIKKTGCFKTRRLRSEGAAQLASW